MTATTPQPSIPCDIVQECIDKVSASFGHLPGSSESSNESQLECSLAGVSQLGTKECFTMACCFIVVIPVMLTTDLGACARISVEILQF